MIFSWYSRVVVEIAADEPGGVAEEHIFDHDRLMLTEVQEIERCTGLSYLEWEQELRKYQMTAVAALVHILRRRADMPSDWATMQFNVRKLNVWPVHADDTRFTSQEIDEDLARRVREAASEPDPTQSAADAAAAESPETTSSTSPSSANGSTSVPGNGTSSLTAISSAASPISTPS